MSQDTIGTIGFFVFLFLIFIGIPIGAATAFIGFIGFTIITGFGPISNYLGAMVYENIAKYTLSVIPLFVLMGHFAMYANIAEDVFEVGKKWFGRIPGGLVQATCVAEAAFGAASGSMMATCAVMSKVTIPQMLKAKVNKRLAFGVVCASSTVDGLIPPSIAMAIYGILTETSIGKLLVAGVIPGIMVVLSYMLMVYIRCKINPNLAPMEETRYTWKERISVLRRLGPFSFIVISVLGGIYSGMFTPTEAGAIGAFGTGIIALIMKKLGRHNLRECLLDTIKTTASIFFILSGALIFSYFLTISHVTNIISDYLLSLNASAEVLVILILIFYILAGAFMDELAAMFVTLPILWPILMKVGVDPIWFGVMMCLVQAVGLITPPYGLNIFIIKACTKDASSNDIMIGSASFLLINALCLTILFLFPEISLFLPKLMQGN